MLELKVKPHRSAETELDEQCGLILRNNTERILQYILKLREIEEDPTTYGMSAPYEVATGCTA
jgi:hypothetical protein